MRVSHLLDAGYRVFRDAVRVFRRTPVSTAVLVLTLAFGIGSNVGMFSLINALLLESLPVKDPQDLYFVGLRGGAEPGTSSHRLFQRLQARSPLIEIGAFQGREFRVTIDGRVEFVAGSMRLGISFNSSALTP